MAQTPTSKTDAALFTTTKGTTPTSSPLKRTKPGKTVVTKVQRYRLVRLKYPWQWEVAYEMHVLLLPQQKNPNRKIHQYLHHRNNSRRRHQHSSPQKQSHKLPMVVEERTLVKTTQDVEYLLQRLESELLEKRNNQNTDSTYLATTKPLLEKMTQLMCTLPRLQSQQPTP